MNKHIKNGNYLQLQSFCFFPKKVLKNFFLPEIQIHQKSEKSHFYESSYLIQGLQLCKKNKKTKKKMLTIHTVNLSNLVTFPNLI